MAAKKGYKHPGNAANLKPFKRGTGEQRDPRINMGGSRARGQKQLSAAIQNFLNASPGKDQATRLDELMRLMLNSNAALDRKTLLEYGFGKLPQPVQAKFEGDLTVRFVDETTGEAEDAGAALTELVTSDDDGDEADADDAG